IVDATTGEPFEYTAADFTLPTTLAGYKTYTDGVSTVWVKIPVVDQPPLDLPTTPTPKEGLPAAGDSSNLNLALAAGAAALAAAAGSCFVLVLRKRRS
ncbi:MAG: LPXTG cell wall anchor domain-containing protein, partial [Actinomycetia bacterium]|nr:LPXTG cell wall anchor domain-containing protein [Actinomycetes bacterium]